MFRTIVEMFAYFYNPSQRNLHAWVINILKVIRTDDELLKKKFLL